MNDGLIVDDRLVLSMFKEFNATNRKRVFRNAIRESLNIIKKKSIDNLKGVINPRMINHRDKWGNSFRKGVAIKIAKDALSGKIHIMKNFKLKFFELGTNERRVRHFKGRSYGKGEGPKRGIIRASHFYTSAVNSEERKVFSTLDRLISKSIVKINNKYR